MVPEVTNKELQAELLSGQPPLVLDVREADELLTSRLEDIVHIPLGELPDRLGELDKSARIVVVCRTGGRSGHATQFLTDNGFRDVRNMIGGMNGWAKDIDSTMKTY